MKIGKIGLWVILFLGVVGVLWLTVGKPKKIKIPKSTGTNTIGGVEVVQKKDYFGITEKWEPEKGDLTVKADDGHQFVVHLDGSSQEQVLVGEAGRMTMGKMIITDKSVHWATGSAQP
ncbi:MAG TPA: hypothetical protein VF352_00595 [Anaerolineales bacterium]